MGEEVHMPTLTDAVLRRTIARGETSTVELKKAVPRPGELAERMCGMANAQGGNIILGVLNLSVQPNNRQLKRLGYIPHFTA